MYGWLIYDREGRARNGWLIGQLLSFADKNGEDLRLIEAEKIKFGVRNGEIFVSCGDLPLPDYAIVRTICPLLSSALESVNVRVHNNALVSEAANDKRKTQALCAALGIPTPDTFFLDRKIFDPSAYSYPMILKSPDGHGGTGVFYVEETKSASDAVEKLKTGGFLLQEVVDKGRDVRLYMLGNRLLCAVERTSKNDFRSNFSLGGSCRLFEPTKEMIEGAKKIADALHPTFIGVDFVFKDGAPLLNEIEDVVGARMVYRLTDVKVHELLLNSILN